jgi:hypothetical protein
VTVRRKNLVKLSGVTKVSQRRFQREPFGAIVIKKSIVCIKKDQ